LNPAFFKSYFKNITYLKGGADSGFRHVKPEEYKHRLFQYNKIGKNIVVKEVSLNRESLHSNDVFLLDMGLRIIQWNGSESAGLERYSAAKYIQDMENERGTQIDTTVIDEHAEEDSDEFYASLNGELDSDVNLTRDLKGPPHLAMIGYASEIMNTQHHASPILAVQTRRHRFRYAIWHDVHCPSTHHATMEHCPWIACGGSPVPLCTLDPATLPYVACV